MTDHPLTDEVIARFWPDMDNPDGRADIRRQYNAMMEMMYAPAAEVPMCCAACGIITTDNRNMKRAGTKLAEAALYTVSNYDGLHRLSLAVAEWSKVIANEAGRADRHGTERDSPLRALQLIADAAARPGLNTRDKTREMERIALNAIEAITGSAIP